MEPAELERSKAVLLALVEELERPSRNRDEIAIENAPDSIDRVQGATERELAVRQMDLTFNRLQSIRSALRRIEDGTYGACVRCDGDIGSKRLRALPWASQCVKCQDLADQENRVPHAREVSRALG
jgi:DnaK suppressor protein